MSSFIQRNEFSCYHPNSQLKKNYALYFLTIILDNRLISKQAPEVNFIFRILTLLSVYDSAPLLVSTKLLFSIEAFFSIELLLVY